MKNYQQTTGTTDFLLLLGLLLQESNTWNIGVVL